MNWFGRISSSFISLMPLLAPFTSWMYLQKFSRKVAIRFLLLISITPIIGYLRRPYVIRQYNQQIQQQIESKQTQMKQSLLDANLDFKSEDNNFEYMVLVRTERKLEDEELFEKQKVLFEMNNQILERMAESGNYFDGIKFLFMGEERVYQGLEENITDKDNINFDYIKKQAKQGAMSLPKPDTIQLIAKQPNGDNKILMQWEFEKNITLKAIIRQISKHKHKKYVQSMNF